MGQERLDPDMDKADKDKPPDKQRSFKDYVERRRQATQEGQAQPGQQPPECGADLKPPEELVERQVAATAYDKLVEVVGYHLAEIYGVRGTGKSRFVHAVALEAQAAGKRVLFLDTEGGLDDRHVRQLKHYEYIGDELDDLRQAVAQATQNRDKFDLLIVDSVGHPVYVNYVTMGGMDAKLRSYQELAALFRDMVRFSRGERGKDMGTRFALSIAVDHTVSEFTRIARDLPMEEPLDPFGGQIHRVPKFIARCEPVEYGREHSIFRLVTWKARDLPRDLEVARFIIDAKGCRIQWRI